MWKKKDVKKHITRRRAKVVVDPDIEWYCTECKSIATHMGRGNWITCPKCGNRDDGKTRKLGYVTKYRCAWCHNPIDPNSIMGDKEPMATCHHCRKHVHITSSQESIEEAVLNILKKGD